MRARSGVTNNVRTPARAAAAAASGKAVAAKAAADKAIADGPSIMEYLRETVAEYRIDRHIRFDHLVRSAEWSSDESRWSIEVEQGVTGERVTFTCGFLFMCSGYYSYQQGYTPECEGRVRFRG